jgi:hypothetical protein
MSTIACLKNNIGIRDHPSEMVLPNSNVCVTPEEAETIRSGNAEVLKVHVLKTTGRLLILELLRRWGYFALRFIVNLSTYFNFRIIVFMNRQFSTFNLV